MSCSCLTQAHVIIHSNFVSQWSSVLAAPIHTPHKCKSGGQNMGCTARSEENPWHGTQWTRTSITSLPYLCQCPAEREPSFLMSHNSTVLTDRLNGLYCCVTFHEEMVDNWLGTIYMCIHLGSHICYPLCWSNRCHWHKQEKSQKKQYRKIDFQYNFVPRGSEALSIWEENTMNWVPGSSKQQETL